MPYRKPRKSQMKKILPLRGGFAPAAQRALDAAKPYMAKKTNTSTI